MTKEWVGTEGETSEMVLGLVDLRGVQHGYLSVFYGPSGQVVKCFSKQPITTRFHDKRLYRFTVKKHGEYQGVKETVVSRLVLA